MIKDEEKYFDINSISNQEIIFQSYDKTFELMINIMSEIYQNQLEKNKKLNIIQTLLKNILTFPQEEKFRKLKLSNINIQNLFQINGVYEFFSFLRFQEQFIDNELYLVLSNPDLELISIIYSYLNLLVINELDINDNIYDSNQNENKIDLPSLEDITNNKPNQNIIHNKNMNVVNILKDTKDMRVNENSSTKDNNLKNLPIQRYKRNNRGEIDIKSILKETSSSRINNNTSNNLKKNDSQSHKFFTGNNNSNFATLSDLRFSNPDQNNIFKNNFKVKDEIGKKCLELSNEFRRTNGLSPLEWDDNVWKISFEHSQNMGTYKVKFGHEGFNNRIRKLPFDFYLACENVFMCQGISEFNLAEMAVNGWINSPGHRKNLISNTSHCAIAVFRNSVGEFFLTQIFVRK